MMGTRSRKAGIKTDRNEKRTEPAKTAEKRDVFASLGLGREQSWMIGTVAALTVATLILNGDGLTFEGDNILIALIWMFLASLLLFVRWYRNKPFWLGEHDDETKNRSTVRWFDIVAVIFFGWVFVSFTVAWCSGNGGPRAMLTMLAHWGGFAAMFTTWRLLLNGRLMICGMLLLLVAAVIGESSAAYYHYYHVGPQTRQEYFNAQKQESGTNGYVPLTGEQQLQENRIKSPEPLGTYSLTNSLAGVLAPWCVFLCGIFLLGRRPLHVQSLAVSEQKRQVTLQSLFVLLMTAFVGFILMMTNSRSGMLATLFGVTCLIGTMIVAKVRNKRVLLATVVGVWFAVALGLGIGFASGGLADSFISGATKSFGYRVQYWQSSSQMIADYPFFGSGIGNFREYYTQYKLPTASETISDPHNLFYEVAANAGLPALICFVVLLTAAIFCALTSKQDDTSLVFDTDLSAGLFDRCKRCWQLWLPFFVGGVVGIIAAFVYSLTNNAPMSFDMTCFVLAGFTLGFFLFIPIMDSTIFPLKVLAPICLAALSVNLLAAGGIAFPHVNVSFWFFMALCFNGLQTSDFRLREKVSNANPKARYLKPETCTALCFLALAAVLYPTAWLANLQANTLLRNMEANPVQYVFIDKRIAAWEKVVELDPYRTQVWCNLCAAYLLEQRELPELSKKRDDTSRWRDVVEKQMQKSGIFRDLSRVTLNGTTADALVGAIRSSPLSASNYQSLGKIFLDDYERIKSRDSLDLAIAFFELAAVRYPNHSLSYANLAICYQQSGETELQLKNARRAVQLDDIMPHTDQKLPPVLRQTVEWLCEKQQPGP